MTVPPGDSTDDEFAVESAPTHTENSRGSACVGVTPRGRQLLPWAGVVKRKVVLIYESNIRTRMKSKSKVPEYEGTTEVRNGVQGGVVHAKEKKILVMLVIITEGTCPTDDLLSALKETERNGLTIGSQQKRSASGNDALAPAAAATSLEIDWGVVAFEGGVGGEDNDEGREGVHLEVLRGLSCRRGGMRWM